MTSPPLLPRPKPYNTLPPNQIPIPQQSSHINIKRRIRPRIRKQLMNRRHRRRQRINRTPVFRGQERQADLTRGKRDIRVGDPRREVDFRRT